MSPPQNKMISLVINTPFFLISVKVHKRKVQCDGLLSEYLCHHFPGQETEYSQDLRIPKPIPFQVTTPSMFLKVITILPLMVCTSLLVFFILPLKNVSPNALVLVLYFI